MRGILYLFIPFFIATTSHVGAQERTAGSALETQASWSSLSTQIKTVETKTTVLNAKVDQSIACAKQGLLYAPGAAGADASGCLPAAIPPSITNQFASLTNTVTSLSNQVGSLNNQVNTSVHCTNAGMVYNGSTCVAGPSGFKIASVATYGNGSGDRNSKSVIESGWHTLCVLGFNHNDSNFWLNVIEGPNAQGKSRWRANRGAGYGEPILKCFD